MATIDKYKIKVTVDGKDQIIDTEQAVDDLSKKISNFAKVGTAALVGLTASAAKMADTMVDLAGTAGMSASKIYQMSVAAQAAGGSFDQVEGMLLKYSNSVEGAVQGNDKLLDSFTKIGVSRQDLEQLNDEQLFQKIVSGLGNMADGAEKTALTIELLGRKAATTDLAKFANDINQAVDPRLEKTLQDAAKAVDTIEMAFRNLQLAALQTFGPILKVLGEFEFNVEAAQKSLQILGTLIAAAFAASTVAAVVRMAQAMTALAAVIRTAAAAQTVLTALIPGIGTATAIAAIGLGAAAYISLGRAIGDAADAQADFNDQSGFVGPMQPEFAGPNIRNLELSAREKVAEAAKRTTEQMRFQNDLANGLRRTIIDVSNIEQNRARFLIANNQAYVEQQNALFDLESKIQAEKDKGEQTNQAVIAQLEQQKNIVRDQFNQTIRLNEAEFERLNTIRLQNEALAGQLSLINRAFDGVEETARINEIMMQAAGMTTKQREEETKLKLEELRNTKALAELELQLTSAREQGLSDQVAGIQRLISEENTRHATNMNNIDAEQIAIDMLNNSRIAGVVSAMEQLNQQFTPYQMAQDAVLSTWNNIGNAIDQVAQGGKASFKDMARSIIADLGAMIAKQMVFNALKTAFGSTKLFGGIIPGLALGGPAKAGQPYIVGERGPELFVPKQAGTVIPNNKLNNGNATPVTQPVSNNTVNNVYNISAVDAKSVAQLFYENRKTMLGTMNIAQKELPYGMAG